eukprot:7561749-Pyramimonas_sp.AAC.1
MKDAGSETFREVLLQSVMGARKMPPRERRILRGLFSGGHWRWARVHPCTRCGIAPGALFH